MFTSSEGAANFYAGNTSSAGCSRSAGSVTAACVILGFFSAEPDQRPAIYTRRFAQSKGKMNDVKTVLHTDSTGRQSHRPS
jgi:hypothetical protein